MCDSNLDMIRAAVDMLKDTLPQRSAIELGLLKIIKKGLYTWKWHPGTGRITASLTSGYRVTLTPSEDATVVILIRVIADASDIGLTNAIFPEIYVSLDVWYEAYNAACRNDANLSLADIFAGRHDLEPKEVSSQQIDKMITDKLPIEKLVVLDQIAAEEKEYTSPAAKSFVAPDPESKLLNLEEFEAQAKADAVYADGSQLARDNADAIEEIRAELAKPADEAGDCGDEG